MNRETKIAIYSYLQGYLKQKEKHPSYVDYYGLYNLDRNMSTKEIFKVLNSKKLKKLFHPDQVTYIEDIYKDVFLKTMESLDNAKEVFSNDVLRKKYDDELSKQLEGNRSNATSSDRISNQDDANLERAIETTIYKYGFYQGYIALQEALRDDFSKVTRDNNSRELLEQMESKKIRDIITSKRMDIMEDNPSNMVMDYYNHIINKSGLREKADVFYNACLQTASKYDLNTDFHQTDSAISYYVNNLNMYYFTNVNVDKEELSELSPQAIQVLMSAKMHTLGKENTEYLFSNFSKKSSEEQINLFSKEIKKEARKIERQKQSV